VVWFLVKLFLVMYALIWIRATLPRFRYDKLMDLGWKVLIPAGLLWILITGAAIALPERMGTARATLLILGVVLLLFLTLGPLFSAPPASAREDDEVEARA
jgi:NADH-quinone oxidoreductase subunit H